jgi:hypothetical protein
MAMAEPIYGLEDFVRLFEQSAELYPYYSVILYTPQNGLDERLHEYVAGHWDLLNRLTGDSSLLAALENRDVNRGIEDFRPEEVYDIARELGVSVADVPALVFFSSPHERDDILVLKVGEFLPSDVTDEHLTDFFRSLSAIVDSCAGGAEPDRLDCLRRNLKEAWPEDSRWRARASEIGGALVSSTTKTATVVQALSVIMQILGRLV